jgi:hypothetical protein
MAADPGRRFSEELQLEARWWLSQTWGDQGLRLHAERTAALLERAAKLAELADSWKAAKAALRSAHEAKPADYMRVDDAESALLAFECSGTGE